MSTRPPHLPLPALIRIGHEVAWRARRLGAHSLSVEISAAAGPVLFTTEAGRTRATVRGCELELSALPQWERERPPGL